MDPVIASGQCSFTRAGLTRLFRRPFAGIWSAGLVIFLAVSLFPWQAMVAAQSATEKPLLLTRDDGLAIVDTISEQSQTRRRGPKLDCSHLVNAIYAKAGFPYPYAKSADLYRGEPSFVRVSTPQAGDLIVWRGHVGLVTDSRAHLFYSSLRTGLETEDYTSPYWRRKGVPRFYRYRASESRGGYLTARERETDDSEEREGSQARSKARSNAPRVVAVNETAKDEGRFAGEAEGQASPESAENGDTAPSPVVVRRERASSPETKPTVPANVLLPTGRDKPTVEQVDEAISRFQQAVAEAVDAEALLHWRSPVILVKQVQVQRLEFKGKKAFALVSVDSDAGMQRGVVDRFVRHEQQRWELARTKSGWTLNPPAGTLYVPRQAAVHLFAQQLARATEGHPVGGAERTAAGQEGMLAALLNDLLN